jgi:hypothetical protein
MRQLVKVLLIAITLFLTSCEKPAGEGGNSSIKGNIWGENWDNTFTILRSQGPASDIDLFIIYGNETNYGDKISTTPEGNFEFKYLRPGLYKVYVYSKTPSSINPNGEEAVTIDVEITRKKQTVELGKITVKI